MALLQFQNVDKTFFSDKGETAVLKDISFSMNPAEIVAIIGPSGCGKSTILNLASGILLPSSGKVIREADIGYMFQRDHLFDWRTVRENVLLGLEIRHQKTKENLAYADALLEKYGLKEFQDAYPSELSGGMRQRVALIRTLVLHPTLLLLDEPFSALDYQTRLLVLEDVHQIMREEKKAVLIVTHDISEALAFSDRVIVLSSRPCRIKKILDLNYTLKEKRTTQNVRYAPEFPRYFEMIYQELLQ